MIKLSGEFLVPTSLLGHFFSYDESGFCVGLAAKKSLKLQQKSILLFPKVGRVHKRVMLKRGQGMDHHIQGTNWDPLPERKFPEGCSSLSLFPGLGIEPGIE